MQGLVDIFSAKKDFEKVLTTNHVFLNEAFRLSLAEVADQLYQAHIISSSIKRSPSYDDIVDSFKASMNFKRTIPDLEAHCSKFLTALSNINGPVSEAAQVIKEEWIVAVDGKMQFESLAKRTN